MSALGCRKLRIISKPVARRQLHQTRWHGADRLAEVAAGDITLHSGSAKELRVIEEIEGFGTEFERAAAFDNEGAESVASRFSIPGPEKKRRRELPMVPSAGSVNCVTSKTGAPPRGLRLRLSDLPLHSGVSTPLLLMPLGMVPSRDVSLLFSSVTGNPEVKRAIPASAHPEATAWGSPFHFVSGTW